MDAGAIFVSKSFAPNLSVSSHTHKIIFYRRYVISVQLSYVNITLY